MTKCQVTAGFFVLRGCGEPAAAWCGSCRRPVCAAHVAAGGLCPECAAANDYGNDPHSAGWLPRYRRHHYDRSGRTYRDGAWYGALSSTDRRAFDTPPSDGFRDDGHDVDGVLES